MFYLILLGQESQSAENEDKKKKKTKREFDSKLYKKRHVLLKVAYFGWNYHGFAVQETSGQFISLIYLSNLLKGVDFCLSVCHAFIKIDNYFKNRF